MDYHREKPIQSNSELHRLVSRFALQSTHYTPLPMPPTIHALILRLLELFTVRRQTSLFNQLHNLSYQNIYRSAPEKLRTQHSTYKQLQPLVQKCGGREELAEQCRRANIDLNEFMMNMVLFSSKKAVQLSQTGKEEELLVELAQRLNTKFYLYSEHGVKVVESSLPINLEFVVVMLLCEEPVLLTKHFTRTDTARAEMTRLIVQPVEWLKQFRASSMEKKYSQPKISTPNREVSKTKLAQSKIEVRDRVEGQLPRDCWLCGNTKLRCRRCKVQSCHESEVRESDSMLQKIRDRTRSKELSFKSSQVTGINDSPN